LLRAEFIAGSLGRLFCTFHEPPAQPEFGDARRAVLVVPALGDEMNKTRQTLARIGERLTRAGLTLVIPDLFGTGDSEGEFRDAIWDVWRDDLMRVIAHARQTGCPIAGFLTVRSGVLLGMDVLSNVQAPTLAASVWLQPTPRGDQFLTQLLRLRVLGSAVAEGKTETVEEFRNALAAGDRVNVGGYELTCEVAGALDTKRLDSGNAAEWGQLLSVEVSRQQSKVGETSRMLAGRPLSTRTFPGEPYWTTTETVVVNEVVAAAATHLIQHLAP
jgi:exosortase A-associated hydrolase 2